MHEGAGREGREDAEDKSEERKRQRGKGGWRMSGSPGEAE